MGDHNNSAADGNSPMHDQLLVARRHRHLRRRVLIPQHHLDFSAELLLVVFERRFAIAVVMQIWIDHRLLLWFTVAHGLRSRVRGYFSAALFRLASPASKSLPIILSMFMTTCITLCMRGAGPRIIQLTLVAPPCGSIVNSAVL